MVFLCLKLKAVAAYLHVEKIKQMEGRQAQYTRSLKPPAMAMNRRDHDQRAEHRHYDGSLTTQGYCEYAPTLGKLRQNVGNRMVLTYNDVGHTPKCPQIGVLLNNRATKLAAFLLYKFGVR